MGTSLACSSPSRRSPRSRSLPPLRKPLRLSLRRTPMPRRRRRRRRRPPSKLAVFSTFMPRLWLPLKGSQLSRLHIPNNKKDGQYEGRDRPHSKNIVGWYLTSTDISFIINSQFTNKVGKSKKNQNLGLVYHVILDQGGI